MVYVSSLFFLLGLMCLGLRVSTTTAMNKFRFMSYSGVAGSAAVLLACVLTIYVGLFQKTEEQPLATTISGDFGLSDGNEKLASLNAQKQELIRENTPRSSKENANNPMAPRSNASGLPSVFSVAQTSQICQGFAEVAMGALLAGSKNEPYPPYEEKAKQLTGQVMRLPFVREAGSKPMQQVSTLFATLIEDQYYISPQNRAVQLGLISKVDKKMALDAMNQVCELKILEIRSK